MYNELKFFKKNARVKYTLTRTRPILFTIIQTFYLFSFFLYIN